jgi:AcrR family transcriptional regulator
MAELPDHFRSAPTGTERISRDVLAEHQRERVLALVTPVFAKRGYQGTTVDDLLAAGKVGVGNFYSLFGGKEDCFLAAFDRVVTRARSEMAAAMGEIEGWPERAYIGLGAVLQIVVSDPLDARLVMVEAQGAGGAAIGRYNALLDEAVAWLTAGRAANPRAAALPPSFEQTAVSGLGFYLQQCLLDSRRHSLEELLGETAGLLLEPIVGEEELARLGSELALPSSA